MKSIYETPEMQEALKLEGQQFAAAKEKEVMAYLDELFKVQELYPELANSGFELDAVKQINNWMSNLPEGDKLVSMSFTEEKGCTEVNVDVKMKSVDRFGFSTVLKLED